MISAVITHAIIAVLIVAFVNGHHEAGYWIWGFVAVGSFLNSFVIQMNGDRMPVVVNNAALAEKVHSSPRHCIADRNSKFVILGDVIPILGFGKASIGDLIVIMGILCALAYVYR